MATVPDTRPWKFITNNLWNFQEQDKLLSNEIKIRISRFSKTLHLILFTTIMMVKCHTNFNALITYKYLSLNLLVTHYFNDPKYTAAIATKQLKNFYKKLSHFWPLFTYPVKTTQTQSFFVSRVQKVGTLATNGLNSIPRKMLR